MNCQNSIELIYVFTTSFISINILFPDFVKLLSGFVYDFVSKFKGFTPFTDIFYSFDIFSIFLVIFLIILEKTIHFFVLLIVTIIGEINSTISQHWIIITRATSYFDSIYILIFLIDVLFLFVRNYLCRFYKTTNWVLTQQNAFYSVRSDTI